MGSWGQAANTVFLIFFGQSISITDAWLWAVFVDITLPFIQPMWWGFLQSVRAEYSDPVFQNPIPHVDLEDFGICPFNKIIEEG
jgi:hypothetical protein